MGFFHGFIKQAVSWSPKTKYSVREFHGLDPNNPEEAWTAKIDGAHSIVEFEKGKLPDIYSHRISKRTKGKIDYTSKLPHITNKSPVSGKFTAETYAVGSDGKAVEPETVTSILNRGVESSLQHQKTFGLTTRTALINVEKYQGKDVSKAPFEEKREIMEEVSRLNPNFTLPAIAYTPQEKKKLHQEVKKGKHPQTKEGLIVHKLGIPGSPLAKAKIFKEHDVHVRGIYEEVSPTGRAPMAGGIEYSWGPESEVKGRVGTGFSHAEKKNMLENPELYVGRVARVHALGKSKNKVLLKPSFKHWHVEKNIEKQATIFAKQSIIIDKSYEPDREKAQEHARKFADKIYTSRGTSTQWRFRQRPPGLFVPGSFRHAKIKPGVSIIYGQIDEKRKKASK
jgi:hypothetical protein